MCYNRGRAIRMGKATYFLGNWTNSVTNRPISRSKSTSLYISWPSRVSQHWRSKKLVDQTLLPGGSSRRGSKLPANIRTPFVSCMGGCFTVYEYSCHVQLLSNQGTVHAGQWSLGPRMPPVYPQHSHRNFFVIVATGLASFCLHVSPTRDLIPQRDQKEHQGGQT